MLTVFSKAKEFRDTSTRLGFNRLLSLELNSIAKNLVSLRLQGITHTPELDLATDLVINRIREGCTNLLDFPKCVGTTEEVIPVLLKLKFSKEQTLAYKYLQDTNEDGLEFFIAVNKNSLSETQVIQLYIANILLLNFTIGKYDDRHLSEPYNLILSEKENTSLLN